LPQGSSINLLSVISKFEALDALSCPFKENFETKIQDLDDENAHTKDDTTKQPMMSQYDNFPREKAIENEATTTRKVSQLASTRGPRSRVFESFEESFQQPRKLPGKSLLSSLGFHNGSKTKTEVLTGQARTPPHQTSVRDMVCFFDGSKNIGGCTRYALVADFATSHIHDSTISGYGNTFRSFQIILLF
jgi:hypothetical protein